MSAASAVDGAYWMCEPQAIYGFKRRVNGAMAEYMVFTAQSASTGCPRRSPPTMPPSPSRSRARPARRRACRITFGDVVVVAGCGPIGLGMVAGSVAKSAGRVVALDRYPARLDLARKTGTTDVIDVTSVDPIEAVKAYDRRRLRRRRLLRGERPPERRRPGLQLLRKLGRYVEYSVFGAEASVDWTIVGDDKELDILGAHLGPHCWPKAIELIEHDALPLDGICSHQLPLARFEEVFLFRCQCRPIGQSVAAAVRAR